jgi:phenylalanyl-tRNA synthetase beta chain
MNVSRRWLEAFLRIPLDSRDVAARLAMLGAPVDAIEPVGADLGAFVVGLVTDAHQHPNADKLRVTTVDDGSGTTFQVVCGAPNVVAGGKYPFARLGTTMPNGMVIEKRKLRGEASEGMLCSARELGLGDDHDGLLTLATDAAPGTPLAQVLEAGGDERLVVDVTANRADLLGHKGVARELSAALHQPFRLPDIPDERAIDLPTPERYGDEAPVGGIRVAIDDADGCGRLLAAVIRGVRIGPSPAWLASRLEAVGVRSINNVVDATNYVMFELNQPMHAYDATRLAGPALIVRRARDHERLMTLDGTDRALPVGTLVIADADRVIGVAGVMGGRASEVTANTTDVLLECAWFDPARVRRAARALGLSTEASHRFERGTDRWGAVDAMRRCVRLIVTVAGGELDGPVVDCFPSPTHPPRVFVRPARVAQVLGVDFGIPEIERQLVAMGATVVNKPGDDRIAVDVPGWRPDINAEIDLIEEIARLHGYERFPVELRGFRPGARHDDPVWATTARLRVALVATGLAEAVTLPMVDRAGADAPRVLNPLSAEHSWLRDALLPSLIRQVEANWAQHVGDVRLFELGTAFEMPTPGEPVEQLHAAFVVTGAREPRHWTDREGRAWDGWDARGIFERVVKLADQAATIHVEAGTWVACDAAGQTIGHCGPCAADAPPWAPPLYGGEVTVAGQEPVVERYEPVAIFPAVERDLAVLLRPDQPVDALLHVLRERGRRHGLEAVRVIDEYRGEPLLPSQRSVTIRLVFRSPTDTLTDAAVDAAVARLRTSLERECDVAIRST